MTAWPLRARLMLAYTSALLIALAVFSTIVIWQQGRIGLRRVDRELAGLSETLANVLRDELTEKPDAAQAADEASNLVAAAGQAIAILDAHGSVLAARWSGLELPSGRVPAGTQPVTVETPAGAWRLHVSAEMFAVPLTLLVGRPLTDVRREQREAEEAMLVGIPILLLLATGGGVVPRVAERPARRRGAPRPEAIHGRRLARAPDAGFHRPRNRGGDAQPRTP